MTKIKEKSIFIIVRGVVMKFYDLEIKEVLKSLDSNEDGLTQEEFEKRLKENGKNKLQESKK